MVRECIKLPVRVCADLSVVVLLSHLILLGGVRSCQDHVPQVWFLLGEREREQAQETDANLQQWHSQRGQSARFLRWLTTHVKQPLPFAFIAIQRCESKAEGGAALHGHSGT